MSKKEDNGQALPDRIKTFLGEFRMIIPALGALLGFQLTSAFQTTFSELSSMDKTINFAGLACTAAALLLMLVPASYHRFLAGARETERLLATARVSIEVAFVFMPLAIVASLYIQAVRTFDSHGAAGVVAGVSLVFFGVLWWLVPWLAVRKDPDAAADAS